MGYGQQEGFAVRDGMNTRERNYRSFTPQYTHISDEARAANQANGSHPEVGMLFEEAPCKDCYEIIGERTETSKKFVIEGTNGRDVALQTSSDAMHYRDEAGQWRTIKTKLEPDVNGVYAARHQPVPVVIGDGYSELGAAENKIRFNRGLVLVYRQPNGEETRVGVADWSKRTAGDDGVYITDVWPGIDMEMSVSRGALKTNFYIKHSMSKYAGGQLLIRDHWTLAAGLQLYAPEKAGYKGNLEVRNSSGKAVYLVGAATAYEKNNAEHTLQMIGYDVDGGQLDIMVPGDMLNRPADAYPVVIDPLISTATLSTVGGSSYSPSKTVSCNYVNAATVPPGVTVTDVKWSFNYVSSGGALLLHGGVDYTLGACRSPGVAGFFWYCNLSSSGTCTGSNISIISDIASCIPPPQCLSYNMNLNMRFYQNYATTTPCATTYITAGTPLTVTVFGRTVETGNIVSAGGVLSICTGQTVTLSTTPGFGVPPYSYVWNPGGTPGNPLVAAPVGTTSYTVTVTDACGTAANAQQTIIVTPIASNTGTAVVCIGSTTTLSNPSGAGTWSSSTGAVAVVGPSTGIVTGVTPGTATITFTNAAGCYATTVVTVLPMPGAIMGVPSVCVGSSTALTDPMPSGTWSSSAPTVAVVGGGTGLVTGMSPGTATISYSTSPGCTATMVVTVNANPSITSVSSTDPTTCGATNGTITLNGLVPGTTYDVGYMHNGSPVVVTMTANASGQIVLTGLSAGLYTGMSVKSPAGCTGIWGTTITLVDLGTPPVPVAGNNSPICDGWILKLTATSAPGVTYNWTGPGGFTSTLQNPQIDPATMAAAGVYSVTASLLSCVSQPGTTTVVVNPLPHIGGITSTNPITCGGSEGTLTLQGLVPGITYTIGFMLDGTPATVTAVADVLGNATVYGRVAGTYTNIFVQSLLCVSNQVGPVTLVNPTPPPPPAISSNAPICQGLTLLLFGSDDAPNGTFLWKGPNGFISTEQNPIIPYVTAGAQGVYTLSYTTWNCTSTTTADIELRPIIALSDITALTHTVNYGDSVQLHVDGATYYNWTPHNGSMVNYYISDPFVRPQDSVSVYTVHGMNEWGCHDSANVTLRVIFDEQEYIPTAFTPNGDGKNDVFKIGRMRYKKLVDFTIYDRWGREVYHNPWDPNDGWDGTAWGREQDMGTYYYSIMIESPSGKIRYYKGDVTLIR